MDKAPGFKHEVHMLFEHGFKLDYTFCTMNLATVL